MDQYDLQGGAAVAIAGFRDVNGYLQAEAPWLKKGDENAELRQIIVRATLEAIYALTHLLMPFLDSRDLCSRHNLRFMRYGSC